MPVGIRVDPMPALAWGWGPAAPALVRNVHRSRTTIVIVVRIIDVIMSLADLVMCSVKQVIASGRPGEVTATRR